MDHIQIKKDDSSDLGRYCCQTGQKQVFKGSQYDRKDRYGKNGSEKIGFSRQIQASLALKLRFIHVRVSVNHLIDHQKEQNGAFFSIIITDSPKIRPVTDHHKHSSGSQSDQAGYISVLPVISKGIFASSVCNVEGADAKISH